MRREEDGAQRHWERRRRKAEVEVGGRREREDGDESAHLQSGDDDAEGLGLVEEKCSLTKS